MLSVVRKELEEERGDPWESCLENMAAKLMEPGIAETCLTKHRFIGDAWNAEL